MKANTTDEFYIAAPREAVQRALLSLGADGASWWPGARAHSSGGHLRLRAPTGRPLRAISFEASIANIRPPEGFTWMLESGELVGRAEWWLEAFKNGTIVHYYLDVERSGRPRARRLSTAVRRHRWAIRRGVNALKDVLEQRDVARAS